MSYRIKQKLLNLLSILIFPFCGCGCDGIDDRKMLTDPNIPAEFTESNFPFSSEQTTQVAAITPLQADCENDYAISELYMDN